MINDISATTTYSSLYLYTAEDTYNICNTPLQYTDELNLCNSSLTYTYIG